jgi:hypothetical protein
VPSEGYLQTKVLEWLRENGGAWFNITPSRWSRSGVPDIVGCYNGWFVGIELKKPKQYRIAILGCTAAQMEVAEEITNLGGGYWFCCDSLVEVQENIRAIELRWKDPNA